jgi:hypothetical protein
LRHSITFAGFLNTAIPHQAHIKTYQISIELSGFHKFNSFEQFGKTIDQLSSIYNHENVWKNEKYTVTLVTHSLQRLSINISIEFITAFSLNLQKITTFPAEICILLIPFLIWHNSKSFNFKTINSQFNFKVIFTKIYQ